MNRRTFGFAALLAAGLAAPPPAVAWPKDQARVITQAARPAECLSPVAIRVIDGEEKFVRPQGFTLPPGTHSLSGTVALDTTHCKVERGNEWSEIEPLTAEFEAGKTYYVGFDHSAPDRSEWALVVWKVE